MSKRKFSEVEMIGALKQMEAGRSAAEVGRELGVWKHTVYAWKAKYGRMSVGEAQRLRQAVNSYPPVREYEHET
jgi:putative transposase